MKKKLLAILTTVLLLGAATVHAVSDVTSISLLEQCTKTCQYTAIIKTDTDTVLLPIATTSSPATLCILKNEGERVCR